MIDNRVMSGTWGQVYVDGELWIECDSFQAKYTKNKSDINMCGEMVVGTKITSVKGTGSISAHKVYTRNTAQIDAILDGKDVRCTIVGKLDDPDAFGAERVALYNVSFDDETLADFAAGSPGKISYPFTFGRREWLDKVEA
jgi:hypothetical protein